MTAHDILRTLIRVQPEFEAFWMRENLFVADDGFFTVCGVFSHFTGFFRERHHKMKKAELESLAALVGCCEKDEFLSQSAYTCFLENIAGDPPDKTLAPYLSAAALEFMSHWRSDEKRGA